MSLPCSHQGTEMSAFCGKEVMWMEGSTSAVPVIWYPKGTHHAVKLPPIPIRGLFLSDFPSLRPRIGTWQAAGLTQQDFASS